MKVDVYDLVVNQFCRSLNALKDILNRAESHAKERGFDPNAFLQMRLAPDMFPFVRQVQIATDVAKGAATRLSNKEGTRFEDNETSLSELIQRVERTIAYLADFQVEDFNDFEDKQVSFPWIPNKFLSGKDFLVTHAIPNFYFHTTTAYNLLRSHGVAVGKRDFLGQQNWQDS